jgi:hypothetical protein
MYKSRANVYSLVCGEKIVPIHFDAQMSKGKVFTIDQYSTQSCYQRAFLPSILACVLLRYELPWMAGRRSFLWEDQDPLLYAQDAVHAPTCRVSDNIL